MAYIPSRRVLAEGGYEGGGAMVYYSLPSPWAPSVERTILDAVARHGTRSRADSDFFGCRPVLALQCRSKASRTRAAADHKNPPARAQAMRTTWTFSSAGQIIFGTGAVEQLADVVSRLGLKRVLVVTDARLVEAGTCRRSRDVCSASAGRSTSLPAASPSRRCAWPSVHRRRPASSEPDGADRPGRRQQHGPGQDHRHGAGARRHAARLLGRGSGARADRCR